MSPSLWKLTKYKALPQFANLSISGVSWRSVYIKLLLHVCTWYRLLLCASCTCRGGVYTATIATIVVVPLCCMPVLLLQVFTSSLLFLKAIAYPVWCCASIRGIHEVCQYQRVRACTVGAPPSFTLVQRRQETSVCTHLLQDGGLRLLS